MIVPGRVRNRLPSSSTVAPAQCIRFESASITTLRAALLTGIGVAAFGTGMIPEGVQVLPRPLLPRLANTEYLLDWRPDCTDRVVTTFASILGVTAPLIIQRLVD